MKLMNNGGVSSTANSGMVETVARCIDRNGIPVDPTLSRYSTFNSIEKSSSVKLTQWTYGGKQTITDSYFARSVFEKNQFVDCESFLALSSSVSSFVSYHKLSPYWDPTYIIGMKSPAPGTISVDSHMSVYVTFKGSRQLGTNEIGTTQIVDSAAMTSGTRVMISNFNNGNGIQVSVPAGKGLLEIDATDPSFYRVVWYYNNSTSSYSYGTTSGSKFWCFTSSDGMCYLQDGNSVIFKFHDTVNDYQNAVYINKSLVNI